MTSNPYIRQVLILLLYIPLWIINFFIHPILFITGLAPKIIKNTEEGKVNFLSWFINTDEPTLKEDMYGDIGYLTRKGIPDIENKNFFRRLWQYWIWNVIRNSFFYFKLHVLIPIPKPVYSDAIHNITNTTDKGDMEWCTWGDRGTIHTEYYIDGVKYFRYSQTKIVNFFFFWKRERKIQFGTSGIEDKNRYIYKLNYR